MYLDPGGIHIGRDKLRLRNILATLIGYLCIEWVPSCPMFYVANPFLSCSFETHLHFQLKMSSRLGRIPMNLLANAFPT